jgi:hypothetical protein
MYEPAGGADGEDENHWRKVSDVALWRQPHLVTTSFIDSEETSARRSEISQAFYDVVSRKTSVTPP